MALRRLIDEVQSTPTSATNLYKPKKGDERQRVNDVYATLFII